jgi:arylsulfatase A-like enzyme
MFSGKQAHEHGVFNRKQDTVGKLSLLDSLSECGYRIYGVSANPFASPHFEFDASFDQFEYTNGVDMVDPSGIDAHERLQRDGVHGLLDVLQSIISHEHPLKSLANLARTTVGATAERVPSLRQVPHPWIAWGGTFGFSYKPRWNTERICDVLETEAEREGPFFLFSNYMDPHHPYRPPAQYVTDETTVSLQPPELYELNEAYGQPWTFLKQELDGDGVPEVTLRNLQELYAGEVKSLDQHLASVVETLRSVGLWEETIVVVTADHGELLGERDRAGRRRIGHEATVDDAVTHVPLVIAHPSFPSVEIDERMSLLELPDLLTGLVDGADPLVVGQPADRIVTCASPAHGGAEVFDAFDLPHEVLSEAVTTHAVVGYLDEWKVTADSTGSRQAEFAGDERSVSTAPDQLVQQCEDIVSTLLKVDNIGSRNIEPSVQSQLEDMGYL